MAAPPVQVERRAGQRFPYLLPLSLRQPSVPLEGMGLTQDVSSRGVFFVTDALLTEGSEIEITLQMPSEVTLCESMRVRCRGRVLRVLKTVMSSHESSGGAGAETKVGVAVRFESYEYLTEPCEPVPVARVATLHSHPQDEQPLVVPAAHPVGG